MDLGVALDVGTKHMALCALWFPHRSVAASPELCLAEARRRMQLCRLEKWEVSALDAPPRASFPDRLSAVARFVRERAHIFSRAKFVVVEHQMQSEMRVIAGALFAVIAMIAPDVELIFQQSFAKLQWNDLESVAPGMDLRGRGAYAARKKAAVAAACFLLGAELPAPRRCPAALQFVPGEDPMRQILLTSAKRDDLADALLHLLVFDHRRSAPPRSRKRCRASAESTSLNESAPIADLGVAQACDDHSPPLLC